MIKDIIDKAIKTEGIIEMVYSRDGITSKFYQLRNVSFSEDYGGNCISGTPINSKTELTFRIDKIKDIQLMWNNFLYEKEQLNKEGIYIIEFLGDNSFDIAIRNFMGGEELSNSTYHNHLDFVLDFEDLICYHYLPYYSEANTNFWKSFDREETVNFDAIYVFAYTIEGETNNNMEGEYMAIPSPYRFKNLIHLGIHYTAVSLKEWESLDKIRISEGVTILGFSRVCKCSSEQLNKRNEILWELYHKE